MTYYFSPHKIHVFYELKTHMFPLVVVFPRQNSVSLVALAALFIAVPSGFFYYCCLIKFFNFSVSMFQF